MVSGKPKSTRIPQVDGLSKGPPDLGVTIQVLNPKFFQKSNFCISLPFLVISFQLFGCYLHVLFFLSFVVWCLI